MLSSCSKWLNSIKKVVFSLLVPIYYCLSWILWELLVFDDELMKVISQEISTGIPAMSIKHAEEWTFWPVLSILLGWWLHDVQDNWDSVFVVVSNYTLIRVCSVAYNRSILSNRALCWLPRREVEWKWIRRWSISKQKLLHINVFTSDYWLLPRLIWVVLHSWTLCLLVWLQSCWSVTLVTSIVHMGSDDWRSSVHAHLLCIIVDSMTLNIVLVLILSKSLVLACCTMRVYLLLVH